MIVPRRRSSLSQPEPGPTPPGAAASRSPSSPAIGTFGPDTHRVPATGDPLGVTPQASGMVSVGADFFTAAELAALELSGLPKHRSHVSRLATKDRWPSRERDGRGGPREFPLSALPAPARADLLQRRILEQASKSLGNQGKPRAPRATLEALSHRQAERHAARSVVLDAFDVLKGERSDRATFDLFIAAFNEGHVDVPAWARDDVRNLSRRTLERWLAARKAGQDEMLAGRWAGGRRSIFDLSEDARDFIVGAHATQPLLSSDELLNLLKTNFPQGLPDADGVMLDHPSAATVARFVAAWRADAANAASFLAFIDPDASKSRNRFAAGDASAGIVRLNQRWEFDASPTDVLCSDGRKNLYAIIDVVTRRIFPMVTDTPKTEASLLLLARACMAWGVPEILGTDNGSDFKSRHFKVAVRQLGIHHKLAPPYSPERKPFVERGIGSLQHKFMPLMRGFIGANVAQRTQIRAREAFARRLGVSDAEHFDTVAITGAELQEQLSAWIANIYDHRPHGGLKGRTPHDVAQELLAREQTKIPNEAAVGMLLMPPAAGGGVRVVGKKAIKVGNIEYWVDRLIPGQRLQVRLDPADAGKVWLYSDTDPWKFVGIGLNPELAGLDRAELAGRYRAEQNAFEKEGRARLRKLVRKADIHSVADRMIGKAPVPLPANNATTWSTPELDEALRAHSHDQADAAIADLTDRRRGQDEETEDQRFARSKALRALLDEGREISAESLEWLDAYEGTHEWNGLKLVDDLGSKTR